jgi:HlyD family secretion protein
VAVLLALPLRRPLYWQASSKSKAAPVYVTEEVRRGNLTLNVSANGTLQPTAR